MNVIPEGAEGRLRAFLSRHDVLNPYELPLEKEEAVTVTAPVAEDWMVTLEASRESNAVVTVQVEYLGIDEDYRGTLEEHSEFGEALRDDLRSLFDRELGIRETTTGDDEFTLMYMNGLNFHGAVPLSEAAVGEKVSISISATETIEDVTVPSDVAEQGAEAVRDHLLQNWWFNLSKREKAAKLGLSNAVILVGDDEIEDALKASFEVQP